MTEDIATQRGDESLPQYEGLLELTWTNKSQRLLSHEGGSYEWVPPSDYRVAEVRLLDSAGAIGEVSAERQRARNNLLIRGDALNALTSLAAIPEFAREYVGKVKLAYLDPPFNTQQAFANYDDALEHSVWLTMLRDRLVQIKKLLAPEGSVWLHLDDTEVHRARCVMDEVFGPGNFIANVIWEKKKKPSFLHGQMATITDFILVYGADRSKTPPFVVGRSTAGKGIPFHNKGNAYRTLIFPARSVTFQLPDQVVETQDMSTDKIKSELLEPVEILGGTNVNEFRMAGEWRFGQDAVNEMFESGEVIRISRLPFRPNHVRGDGTEKKITNLFSFRANGVPTNEDAKEEVRAVVGKDFDTPKPEGLLARILEAATSPGDVVLDCFLGSGTTAAVAHKLERRWIGIEWSGQTLDTFVIPRLAKIVEGIDPGGITDSADWSGGGGFRILDVAPSMFAADDGIVMLAEWATNGRLAEATAAQLRYVFEDDPPFVGRRGLGRLAVVDGLVNAQVVKLLVNALPSEERVLVAGTAIDPDAGAVLRELRPGSSVRKIPASILQDYRDAPRWSPRSGNGAAAEAA